MNNRTLYGEKKKERILIEGEGFDMVTNDFDVILRRGKVEKVYHKSDLLDKVVIEDGVEKHEFILLYDTADFGPGQLTCIVKAYVPDEDFPGGTRTDMAKFFLNPIEEA